MKTVTTWDDRHLTFRKGDLICILLVAALALTLTVFLAVQAAGQDTVTLQIWQDGRLMQEHDLSRDQTFTVSGEYSNTVSVQQGRVAILRSDCPGSDCVHSGWIHQPGRSIVCLPNRVEIRLVGKQTVDLVVH